MSRRRHSLRGGEWETALPDTRPAPAETRENIETPDEATRKEIARRLRQERVSPDSIYAFEKTGLMVTEENRDLWTPGITSKMEPGAPRVPARGGSRQPGD